MKKSPFPGMDPWLEFHWGDVHTRLTTYASDQLQPQLPTGLRARVEEYVAVEADDESAESLGCFAPDVRILERPDAPAESGGTATAVAMVAEPMIVPRLSEPETLRRIQIIDTKSGHRVVTSIEFLSMANKTTTAGSDQYRAKQQSMIDAGVNLVEIDLLRSGSWVLAVPKAYVPPDYRDPYRICVVRATSPSVAEVYRVSQREPLPTIRIPLRPNDKDVLLMLQSLLDTTYENGRYEDLDYTQDASPPLTGPDGEWARQLLQEKLSR